MHCSPVTRYRSLSVRSQLNLYNTIEVKVGLTWAVYHVPSFKSAHTTATIRNNSVVVVVVVVEGQGIVGLINHTTALLAAPASLAAPRSAPRSAPSASSLRESPLLPPPPPLGH